MKVRGHQRPVAQGEELVTVRVALEPGEWHGFDAEDLWAERVERGYLLRSAPFHAFDLAVEDIVAAREDGAQLVLDRVVERGGGSTYRVVIEGSAGDRLDAIEELDVNLERADGVVALDVPPHADLDAVYDLLADGEEDGVWTFEEAHVAEER